MDLFLGIVFLIARFWFGLLMLGTGIVAVFMGAGGYLFLTLKTFGDKLGITLVFLMGIGFSLIGMWVLLGCVTLGILI